MRFVNENLRTINEKLIAQIAAKVEIDAAENFKVNKFYPLKNSKAVASFGDHRYYTFENKEVSESWHMGIDLASTQKAKAGFQKKRSTANSPRGARRRYTICQPRVDRAWSIRPG